MPIKEVVCLAYSRKMGGSCFAGIELATGLWIRAVGKYANGALADIDCYMAVGNNPYVIPSLLDVIEIDFISAQPSLAQPENWKISGAEWKRLRRADTADIAIIKRSLADDPELFRGYERYVTKQDIELRPPQSSLTIVRPENLCWRERTGKHGRRGFKGTFTFSGETYELPLTDDQYEAKLRTAWINNGLADGTVDTLLTISLGDLDRDWGRHYKLIAGVLELPKTKI
jgi:hypothetical protein